MIRTFALGWLLAGLAAGPTVLFDDPLDENAHLWQLDAQWQFKDGGLHCTGLAGEVLAVGCQGPAVADGRFILRLHPTAPAASPNAGCGLLYRFDPAKRDGCFVVVGPAGTYGFGRITSGAFALVKRGVSKAIVLDQGKPLELELRGEAHTLKCGGEVVGTWTEAARESGAFGLLVVDALGVAFEDLRIEALGPGAGRTALGPFPPSSSPAPTATEGPLPETPFLGEPDVLLMVEWRRHYNRMAAAVGQPLLPDKLDGHPTISRLRDDLMTHPLERFFQVQPDD
ncbi:MAG: hypothetical protein HYU66_24195 [Armatimonadetes bacterium]|nr:hypothetical protein [Armatimonadota bacterium]